MELVLEAWQMVTRTNSVPRRFRPPPAKPGAGKLGVLWGVRPHNSCEAPVVPAQRFRKFARFLSPTRSTFKSSSSPTFADFSSAAIPAGFVLTIAISIFVCLGSHGLYSSNGRASRASRDTASRTASRVASIAAGAADAGLQQRHRQLDLSMARLR